MKKRVVIMGAAGRDFHNFNVYYRENSAFQVIAFTAAQIPDIEGRVYPPALSGKLYPEGIPIYAEEELEKLIREQDIDQVVFSYSDVSYNELMSKASRVLSAGADFHLLGAKSTMLKSNKPVVAVTAVRTGVGKSQTTRKVCDILKQAGKKAVAIRHPMPYGDLTRQISQRFAKYADLDLHDCTIEEREEYEPHIDRGVVVYAGVDYGRILSEAEQEADVIIWDGGNNDISFIEADIYITLVDPHRPGHEVLYHPGETNLRLADTVVINKIDSADGAGIQAVRDSIGRVNPSARVVEAASPITVENGEQLRGKKVLVVEDGPTLTHGEMPYGAGIIAAKKYGAAELVDPRPFAVGSIRDTFTRYSHIGRLLPAMGYGEKQIKELEETINRTDAEIVLVATPIDLRRVLKLDKPAIRLGYELQEIGKPDLEEILKPLL